VLRPCSRCVGSRAPKMVPCRSLAAGNVHQVIRKAIFDIRAPERRYSFFVDRACRSCTLQNGAAPFGDIHKALRSISHDHPRVNGQRLAQHAANSHSTNMRIVQPSSCREESEVRSSDSRGLSRALLHASKKSQPKCPALLTTDPASLASVLLQAFVSDRVCLLLQ